MNSIHHKENLFNTDMGCLTADLETSSMPSLLDNSCDTHSEHNGGDDASGAGPRSGCSTPSPAVALALEVGLNAHEYLEECFQTEGSILCREKFDAVPETIMSDFTIKSYLGRGSFSDVFEVICSGGRLFDSNVRSSQLDRRRSLRSRKVTPSITVRRHAFAMKRLRPNLRSDADQFIVGAEDLVHETAVLANLDHRHIIKVHGRASGHLTEAFVLNDGYFILVDRLDETLHDRTRTWKRTKRTRQGPAAQQLEVACSIADAMTYLHSKNIAFRDLKPDNIGFDSTGVLKLFDFGFAVGLPEKDEDNPAGFLFDRCGTPRYMAPEVGLSLGYGLSADIYSFGILLWKLCALAKPFKSITSVAGFEMAVFMEGRRPAIDNCWPANVKKLIGSCWSATPSERPTMLDIKSSLSFEIFNIPSEKEAPTKDARSRLIRR